LKVLEYSRLYWKKEKSSYLEMQYKWTALSVTTIGATMGGIDTRIAIIGIPTISSQLGANAVEVVWITQAYLLAATISLLLFGRTADMFGRVKLYNTGFIVFTLGSALCALSPNPDTLIAFRLVQGTGAALLSANSVAIITDASPRNELGSMLGINATAFRIGAMAGLTLSGLILTVVDWRGLFYINIPIGIFGTLWARWRLKEISIKDPVKQMDWIGFVEFTSGICLVLLALTFLSYGVVISLGEGAVLLLAGLFLVYVFFRHESNTISPLLDPKLFKIRSFSMGNIAQLLLGLAWAGIILLVPLYLQLALNFTPLKAGIAVLPLEISYLITSVASGRLSDLYDSKKLATIGLFIIALGLVIISSLRLNSPYLQIAPALLLVGIGSGFFTTPMTRVIMASVPSFRRGIASAFMNTIFNIGFTASYGLVVLLITTGISYNAFSTLLENARALFANSLIRDEFLNGFHSTAIALSILVGMAIIPTLLIGTKKKLGEESDSSRNRRFGGEAEEQE
jgi:EmrB/QacA subfamily drug resistance transporter